ICFGISIISLAVFLVTELTIKEPLIELSLFRSYNFTVSNIVIFIFGIGMFGSTFLLPLYLQNGLNYTAIQAGAVFLPVGIIQGIAAPMAGIFSHKGNPKVVIIIGAFLLALSFYLNANLSYLTEHHYIMVIMYLRGLSMGLMFSPLTAAATFGIPREKMGQASGLINVIRQIGGSFGVALLSTFLTTRTTYHMQRFGEGIQQNSPAFKATLNNMSGYIMHNAGSAGADAAKQGQALLMSSISKQAFIQAVSDDFLIAAGITLLSALSVFLIRLKTKKT
ncbi:MAG: MFS transporter, partial [Syntrophothermus sp.]